MPYGLKETVINKIRQTLASFPEAEEAILYGSRAKGNFSNGSDIDLALKGNSLNQSILQKIRRELDDLLLPYTIDIAIYHSIENQDLTDHIKRMGIVLYSSGR
ncbi:MAG: nucleotidyltransferase domain-containing protein [Bacteroidales bacterium]|nr:nucleotidyltransferase domain-containing protein [Bacteroidales bacterium]